VSDDTTELDTDEFIEALRRMTDAYPEDIFPTPPPERQAKDAAAAHVMRRLAVPWIQEAADRLEHLAVDYDEACADVRVWGKRYNAAAKRAMKAETENERLRAIVTDLADSTDDVLQAIANTILDAENLRLRADYGWWYGRVREAQSLAAKTAGQAREAIYTNQTETPT
jgi:hypothetical protein